MVTEIVITIFNIFLISVFTGLFVAVVLYVALKNSIKSFPSLKKWPIIGGIITGLVAFILHLVSFFLNR